MRTRAQWRRATTYCGSSDAVGCARGEATAACRPRDASSPREGPRARSRKRARWRRRRSLERDVVVGRRSARRAAGRGGCEVVRVDGDVGAGAEAVAGRAAVVTRAREELHRIGDDVDRLALLAVVALPLAPLEAAVDRDGAALGEVAGAVLALRAPDGDVEVVGLVDPLTGRVVLAARVARDAQLADRGAARERAKLGI